jgi:hypothetical protein
LAQRLQWVSPDHLPIQIDHTLAHFRNVYFKPAMRPVLCLIIKPGVFAMVQKLVWGCGWFCVVLQVKLLKDLFRQALGDEGAVRVDINTIDGFQVYDVTPSQPVAIYR